MSSRFLIRFLCGLALTLGVSAFGQYGYVPQGSPDPGTEAYGNSGYSSSSYSSSSHSNLLGYGQLEANYSFIDFKDSPLDGGNGIGASLMAELFKPFFLHGTVNWVSGSGDAKDFDFTTIAIGGGAYWAIVDRFHLVAEVGGLYSSLDTSKDSLSFNDGAVYFSPSVRLAVTDALELRAGVTMTSADNFDSTTVDLGGYFRLFSQMDLGLGAALVDVTNTYHAGVRFRW
jgi:hypothetical protein